MSTVSSSFVNEAVVLAAGNGDRFKSGIRQSKLLHPVLGQPLILRTLATAAAAGISSFQIVIGYQAEAVRRAIERGAPPGTSLRFTYNPDWHLENGVSVLAARPHMGDRRFALLMGDHLFEAPVLSRLLRLQMPPGAEGILAVDRRPAPPEVAAEATQVQMEGDYITAIGKGLGAFDGLDTGLFVCGSAVFDALEVARAGGDTTLSGGIRHLAERRLMRGADIGDASWYDIDTLSDLTAAEGLMLAPEPA